MLSRTIVAIIGFALAASASLLNPQNPYSPHKPSWLVPLMGGTWFEGWYSRATLDGGQQLGIIFGSFERGDDSVMHSRNRTLVSILWKESDTHELESFDFHPSEFVVTGGDADGSFSIVATGGGGGFIAGVMTASKDASTVDYALEFLHPRTRQPVNVHMIASDHTPWNSRNNYGPEGKAILAGPLVPLQWFVHSVNSKARVMWNQKLLRGHAHLEKNWGTRFPSEWTWIQANSGTAQLVMAGGDLALPGPIHPKAFLFKFKWKDIEVNWYPVDYVMNPLQVDIDTEAASVSIRGKTDKYDIQVLVLSSSRDDFRRVQCPTHEGFRDYSVESFSARAMVAVKDLDTGESHSVAFDRVALEFGGSLMDDFYHHDMPSSPLHIQQ